MIENAIFHINPVRTIFSLEDVLKNIKGIFIGPENSMIDLDQISCEENNVRNQAVDLSNYDGNRRVIRLLKSMMDCEEGIFFPGTLLRDYGDFFLPVMPIISEGKIVSERVKQTGLAFVDDYYTLAKKLFDENFAEKIKHFRGVFWEEPMKTLQDELKRQTKLKREEDPLTVNLYGMKILPLICNELYLSQNELADKINEDKIDLVVHSCCNLFRSDEERKFSYDEFMRKMHQSNLIGDETSLIACEYGYYDDGYLPFSGIFTCEKGKLVEC